MRHKLCRLRAEGPMTVTVKGQAYVVHTEEQLLILVLKLRGYWGPRVGPEPPLSPTRPQA